MGLLILIILYILVGKLLEHKHVHSLPSRSTLSTRRALASWSDWFSDCSCTSPETSRIYNSTRRSSSMDCCLRWFSRADTTWRRRISRRISSTSSSSGSWALSWHSESSSALLYSSINSISSSQSVKNRISRIWNSASWSNTAPHYPPPIQLPHSHSSTQANTPNSSPSFSEKAWSTMPSLSFCSKLWVDMGIRRRYRCGYLTFISLVECWSNRMGNHLEISTDGVCVAGNRSSLR